MKFTIILKYYFIFDVIDLLVTVIYNEKKFNKAQIDYYSYINFHYIMLIPKVFTEQR